MAGIGEGRGRTGVGGEGEQKRKEGGGERAEEVRRAGGRWGGVQRESREAGTEKGAGTGGRRGTSESGKGRFRGR